ncbi:hypothetical protein RM190_04845 [Paracoccus sp. CPCC 101403]|uniref:Uncharacterized protein n=1 Tax=Paracoccus broussonetiae TaxID=3075834 RepID=A0ABU3EAK1_9RHOB|nr:hypothetical protein [Paracoccus sp. CPCC 101403]MDT1061176.1 hypothetical protein [Paracoccus sp. CPCC 101403]
MNLLGIDPGRKGALAILDSDTLQVVTHDMPASTPELHDLIAALPEVRVCILEQIYAGPQMSRTSVGAMFESFGVLKGALTWRSIPVQTVRPNIWKAALNVPADKNAARRRASEFFPDCADQWKLAKFDGRAEAAMLAWYGLSFAKRAAA